MLTAAHRAAISSIADDYAIPRAVALAIVAKESSGRFFWKVGGKSLPAINIEVHYFYKYLPKHLKAAGVRAGLASPKRKSIKIPSSYSGRYAMLAKMVALHPEAAYQSISIGAGQVMGVHAGRLGYDTAEAMFKAAASAEGQIEHMLKYLVTDDTLYDAVVEGDVKTIARLYNGSAYAENNYDTDLAELIKVYGGYGNVSANQVKRDADAVLLVQIKALGFDSVVAFQTFRGLTPDGIVGPLTTAEVAAAQAEKKAQDTAAAAKTAAAVTTVATPVVAVAANPDVLGAIVKAVEQIKPVIEVVKGLSANGPTIALYAVGAAVLGAVVFTVVKSVRNRPVQV